MRAMHLLRAEQQIGKRQREQIGDGGDASSASAWRRQRRWSAPGERRWWRVRSCVRMMVDDGWRAHAAMTDAMRCAPAVLTSPRRCQISRADYLTTSHERIAARWRYAARCRSTARCAQRRAGGALVCAACDCALPRLGPRVPVLRAADARRHRLRALHRASAAVRPRTRAAFAYAFPLDRLLQALKYGGALAYADYFAGRAGADDRRRGPTLLVALPLAPARQRQRGFNQAQEIARRLARLGGVPAVTRSCAHARHAGAGRAAVEGARAATCATRLPRCRSSPAGASRSSTT